MATGLGGCADPRRIPPIGIPSGTADMHVHIFNGRDFPPVGFLTQVFLGLHDDSLKRDVAESLARFAAYAFLKHARTAEEEQKLLGKGSRPLSGRRYHQARQQRLAQSIDDYVAKAELDRKTKNTRELIGQDRIIGVFYELQTGSQAKSARADTRISGAEISARAFAEDLDTMAPAQAGEAAVKSRSGSTSGTILRHLRWITFFMSDRRDNLAELLRLYGGPGGVAVLSPSIVDFEYWFDAKEPLILSNWESQIELLSEMALRERDHLLLPFASFCPIRAVLLSREGKDPFVILKKWLDRGICGVKLYPPMGFLPWGNAGAGLQDKGITGTGPGRNVTPEAVDEVLKKLYTFCVQHEVPIKSHANNSLAARKCSGKNASPHHWHFVNEPEHGFQDLSVNVAHFGGFEELTAQQGHNCPDDPPSYEGRFVSSLKSGNRLYADLGFWSEVTAMSSDPAERARIRVQFLDLLRKEPLLKKRLMYGSDWVMTARAGGHNHYLNDVRAELQYLMRTSGADSRQDLRNIMSGNARRYLGLDRPDRAQYIRLARFFPGDHVFHRIYPARV